MIEMAPEQFRRLAEIAHREAGLHMPEAKQTFLAARLQKRLRHTGAKNFDAYLNIVSSTGPDGQTERSYMISALTTNVTNFYREPHHFALLAEFLIKHPPRSPMTIWSAGCSTGEEPLSIAATCRAVLGADWQKWTRVLASDVDQAVLSRARDRIPTPEATERLADFPDLGVDTRWHPDPNDQDLIPSLQSVIRYRQHNLLHALPGTDSFLVIFCRNVTIYFERSAQETVHKRLLDRLASGGLLALGHSERLLCPHEDIEFLGQTAYGRKSTHTTTAAGGMNTCH